MGIIDLERHFYIDMKKDKKVLEILKKYKSSFSIEDQSFVEEIIEENLSENDISFELFSCADHPDNS